MGIEALVENVYVFKGHVTAMLGNSDLNGLMGMSVPSLHRESTASLIYMVLEA